MHQIFRQHAENHPWPPRRGSLMVEMVVCTILLSVVGLILAPAIQSVNRQRKAQNYETLTAIELNNLVEMVKASGETSAELEAWYTQRFPAAELTVDVQPDPDETMMAVRLQITRPQFGDHTVQQRSLLFWLPSPSQREQSP